MVWARAALVGGLLLVLAAFAVGTETQRSVSVLGQVRHCGTSIPASWLMSGTSAPSSGAVSTADGRRTAAACAPVVRESRFLVVTAMGLGGLVALAGWTVMSARREAEPIASPA